MNLLVVGDLLVLLFVDPRVVGVATPLREAAQCDPVDDDGVSGDWT